MSNQSVWRRIWAGIQRPIAFLAAVLTIAGSWIGIRVTRSPVRHSIVARVAPETVTIASPPDTVTVVIARPDSTGPLNPAPQPSANPRAHRTAIPHHNINDLGDQYDADLQQMLDTLDSRAEVTDWRTSPATVHQLAAFVNNANVDPRYAAVAASVTARLLRDAMDAYELFLKQTSTLPLEQARITGTALELRRHIDLLNAALKRVDRQVAFAAVAEHADALLAH